MTPNKISECLKMLAKAYLKLNNPRQAIVHAQGCRSVISSKEYLNVKLHAEACRILSKAHGMLNEWEKANQYSEEAHVIRDSTNTQEAKKLAAYALIQHQIESNETELAEKNTQLRIQARIYQTVSLLGLPLLLMLGAAIYYRLKLKKERELKEQQVSYANSLEIKVKERTNDLEVAHLQVQEAKERENVSLALLNQKHIELLDSISKKLQTWQEDSNANPKAIQPALNDIKSAQAQAEEWGSFMLHFERIHPSFAHQLQLKCPTISNNDIKHCAYMKLGMTRKQVADTLSCTEDAVKLSRTRIRKKLGLTADESLQEFINAI